MIARRIPVVVKGIEPLLNEGGFVLLVGYGIGLDDIWVPVWIVDGCWIHVP